MLKVNEKLDIMHILIVYIQSGNAEPGPPLGTVLGNLGVNTVKFCKEFNDFTKDLPLYFTLNVKIYIFDNRTFSFSVKRPSSGSLLKLLKFNNVFSIKLVDRLYNQTYSCIYVKSFIKLAKFIFPYLDLNFSIPIIFGSVRAAGLFIIYN